MVIALAFIGWGLPASVVTATAIDNLYWMEAGDAGGVYNPQMLGGGQYIGIKGDLGGSDDSLFPALMSVPTTDVQDAFKFWWIGGTLALTGGFDDLTLGALDFLLYDEGLNKVAKNGNGYFDDLAAGNYILLISTVIGFDPPFTFTLTGPTTASTRLTGPQVVPEPGTWLLFGAGLLGITGFSRRHRKH